MIATKANKALNFLSLLFTITKRNQQPTFKLLTECPVIMPTACKIFGCYRAEEEDT